MRSRKHFDKAIRILAAGLWLSVWAAYAPAGEAAQPADNAADRIWSNVRRGENPGNPVLNQGPQQRPATAAYPHDTAAHSGRTVPVQGITGYTEAEIRAQMVKKYAPPRPAFRRVSGAAAGADYRPGTADVKIPTLFFPPDETKAVSEVFPVNPDGSFGIRTPDSMGPDSSGYSAEAQRQMRDDYMRKAQMRQDPSAGKPKYPGQGKAARGGSKYKTITVQVPVPAPSPFRALAAGDLRWFTNNKGHYMVALPLSMPYDPLQKLPAYGPMMIRNTSQNEFMAVTVDDPSDTYYYKNQDTFPAYGRAVPVFTETRKNIQGYDVAIRYIRYFLGGEYCLIVDSTGKRAGKTYRTAFIFPERKQYEYLPKVLFSIENLKGI